MIASSNSLSGFLAPLISGIEVPRSNPEQNVVPSHPVTTTARTPSLPASDRHVSDKRTISSGLREFRASGRFRVTIAT